ncbi:MAG TPA: hypothetical protein VJX30_01625 [Terriglobales bacterium]|nr:hypothetical protein [Terriglobales bacterium]
MATITETGLTKNQIIAELHRSPHGKLDEYTKVGRSAAAQEPEFFAHLIAYDRIKGQVRDAKVALPVVSLAVIDYPAEFEENSLAHIALLGPRELERAYRFALTLRLPGRMRKLRRLVETYLHRLESNPRRWDKVAIQHRATLANLYALTHTKRSDRVGDILFKQKNGVGAHPEGSLFEIVSRLKDMTAIEAAGAILENNIPFLIAQGALGKKKDDPDLVLALIKRMTPTQLVTNTKMLEKMGVKSNPALRGAFEQALEKAAKSTRNILKTTRAAETITDEGLKDKLRGLQERQIGKMAGVEGDWLVLGDKSGSMSQAIETARLVAATLAKMVKGKVQIVFFDTVAARVFDVTGKTYEDIKSDTKWVNADGGTSIGSGLQWAIDKKPIVEADGIAIVSDGGENTPPYFASVYQNYSKLIGKEVPVYLYRCDGERNVLSGNMQSAGIDMQVFDIKGGVDFYSLPNLVQTMRTQRYGLVEEIMESKLLTLKDVFNRKSKLNQDANETESDLVTA